MATGRPKVLKAAYQPGDPDYDDYTRTLAYVVSAQSEDEEGSTYPARDRGFRLLSRALRARLWATEEHTDNAMEQRGA